MSGCLRVLSVSLAWFVLSAAALQGQHDPGPRGAPAGAGGFFAGLNANEQNFFNQARMAFLEVDSVSGTIEEGSGLGPRFNGNSCVMCHAEPAPGGSSPGLASLLHSVPNPQVALATLDGATNFVPSFITVNGPVREARFIRNSDGSADGGVHDLYTIKGRSDSKGCSLGQPNFPGHLAANNVIFRIPTPLFGLGLVENTPDATLRANLAATQTARALLGIAGTFNTSGNDGTITRFGWKAQNKSLLIFVGEAYNVEQGVTNELFPNERDAIPGCALNPMPEDSIAATGGLADVEEFAIFIRLLAPPTPGPQNNSALNGSQLFAAVGCALCHSRSLTTADSKYTGMAHFTYHPFSDYALHHMGSGLADNITQGAAGPDQFRTAPLWGLGQRLFFLHDGRTADLMSAIMAHYGSGSEANIVIRRFNALSPSQKQDVLNFLRSL